MNSITMVLAGSLESFSPADCDLRYEAHTTAEAEGQKKQKLSERQTRMGEKLPSPLVGEGPGERGSINQLNQLYQKTAIQGLMGEYR